MSHKQVKNEKKKKKIDSIVCIRRCEIPYQCTYFFSLVFFLLHIQNITYCCFSLLSVQSDLFTSIPKRYKQSYIQFTNPGYLRFISHISNNFCLILQPYYSRFSELTTIFFFHFSLKHILNNIIICAKQ